MLLNCNLLVFFVSITVSKGCVTETLELLINSSVQTPLIKLEFLRNSSTIFRSSYRWCSIQKAVLKNFVIFTGKKLWWSLFLIKLRTFKPVTLLKKTPTQGLSCEYRKIFKNAYFKEQLQMGASAFSNIVF